MFCRSAARGSNLAGRQGVSSQDSRNQSKNRPLSPKTQDPSDLASFDSFVRFRRFASVVAFFKRDDTRNDTRHEHLPRPLGRNISRKLVESPPNRLSRPTAFTSTDRLGSQRFSSHASLAGGVTVAFGVGPITYGRGPTTETLWSVTASAVSAATPNEEHLRAQ